MCCHVERRFAKRNRFYLAVMSCVTSSATSSKGEIAQHPGRRRHTLSCLSCVRNQNSSLYPMTTPPAHPFRLAHRSHTHNTPAHRRSRSPLSAVPNGSENTSNFNIEIGEHRSPSGLMGRINLSPASRPISTLFAVDRSTNVARWSRLAGGRAGASSPLLSTKCFFFP